MNARRIALHLSWVTTLACASLAHAQPVTPQLHQLPYAASLGFESLRLGGGERMGLMSASVLFEPTENWYVGPAIYGAATGSRGGFFVGGAEVQRHWRLTQNNELVGGGFVGGGGGGSAAVGGGLMLKLSLALMHNFGPLKAGVSASRIDFPNGHIRSNQLGVLVTWSGDYNYYDAVWAGERVKNTLRGGLGFDRVALTATRQQLSRSSHPTSTTMDSVGIRADHWITPHWYGGIEAAGAAHGRADGYAEVLGAVGYEHPLDVLGLGALSLGWRAALGLGGGGSIKTNGGVIGKTGATLTLNVTPNYYLALEGGAAAASGGHYHARYAQLMLGMTLDHPDPTTGKIAQATIARNEWMLSVQSLQHAARKDGSKQSLSTLGIQLNHYLSDSIYLTGQAHSAITGGAGAYSVGLVGLGVNLNTASSEWSAGAELLGGAAGGGGVSTQGGAIAQAMGWIGVPVDRHSQLRLGLGKVQSLRGNLNSPVLELSWSQAFGLTGR